MIAVFREEISIRRLNTASPSYKEVLTDFIIIIQKHKIPTQAYFHMVHVKTMGGENRNSSSFHMPQDFYFLGSN